MASHRVAQLLLLMFVTGSSVEFWEAQVRSEAQWKGLSRSKRMKSLRLRRSLTGEENNENKQKKEQPKKKSRIGLGGALAIGLGGAALIGGGLALAGAFSKKKTEEDPNAEIKKQKAEEESKLSDLTYQISNIVVNKNSLLEDLRKIMSDLDDKFSNIETKASNGISSISSAVLVVARKGKKG